MNYGATLESLFQAYFDCRKNKRNTMSSALKRIMKAISSLCEMSSIPAPGILDAPLLL